MIYSIWELIVKFFVPEVKIMHKQYFKLI
jgi:hypothetical protein